MKRSATVAPAEVPALARSLSRSDWDVLFRAVWKAVLGTRMGWGKLGRTGSSECPAWMPQPAPVALDPGASPETAA